MGRNSKRKSSESSEEVDGSYEDVVPVKPFKSGFFVPCHPLLTLAIVYGMYLTIASALCPHTCLPHYLPVAPLAVSLGSNHPSLMTAVAVGAVFLHVLEAAAAMVVAKMRHNIDPGTTIAWGFIVLVAGIFAFWPLLFPAFFFKVAPLYCKVPGSFCLNL